MIRRVLILAGILLLINPISGRGNSTLLSVKKGHEGNKCWAVLDFDQNAVWMGVSQDNDNVLSLYFYGYSGDNDGLSVSLDPTGSRIINVDQMSTRPPLIRINVNADINSPLSVIKKNRYVVINCNDKDLANGQYKLFEDISANPGRVTLVNQESLKDKISTHIHFNGSYDWTGFIRHNSQQATLAIRGVTLYGIPLLYNFDEGNLNQIGFTLSTNGQDGLKAKVKFDPSSSFSIVRKPKFILIETDKEEEMLQLAQQEESMMASPVAEEISLTDEPPKQFAANFNKPNTNSQETSRPVQKRIKKEPVKQETRQIVETPRESVIAPVIQNDSGIPWNRKVSFRFRNTDIKSALRLLASSNDLNIVIDDGVKGSITMNLEQVTLRRALEKMIYPLNCEYLVEGTILTVKPVSVAYTGGRVTKVYRLKYADATNVANVIRRVVSSDSLVEVFYPEFLEYNESAKGRREKNSVAVQGIRRSNILVVTDRPEKILDVDRVIAELDQAPVQIFIESKLVETSPTNTNKLGIDWDKTITAVLKQQAPLTGGAVQSYSVINKTPEYGNNFQMGYLSASEFQFVLDFLKEKTDTRLISNPRLLAMDNEESSISVGTTVPVPRIQRGMAGQSDMVTFEYKEVNIQLNVTPHVTDEDMITMYVNPVIEEIVGWVQYEEHQAPITDKRTVNSIVTVRNGETVVIGGLIKNQEVTTNKKVWLLGNIPLLGKFFQHEEVQNIQKDLMIFITPTIAETR